MVYNTRNNIFAGRDLYGTALVDMFVGGDLYDTALAMDLMTEI